MFTRANPVIPLNCLCTVEDRDAVSADGMAFWNSETDGKPPYVIAELINVPCAPHGETNPTHYYCYVQRSSWAFVDSIKGSQAEWGTAVILEVDYYSDFMKRHGLRPLDPEKRRKYLKMESDLRLDMDRIMAQALRDRVSARTVEDRGFLYGN